MKYLNKKALLVSMLTCLNMVPHAQVLKSSVHTNTLDFPCPPELKIQKFENSTTTNDFKIIVGWLFQYKAKPNNGGTNWSWALGNLDANADPNVFTPYWQFNPPLQDNEGESKIPLSLIPINNNDMGDAYGTIEVSSVIEGNPQTLYSDENQKVKVFFAKDETNYHDATIPNWFFYWRQLIADLLSFNVNLADVSNPITGQSLPFINVNKQIALNISNDIPYAMNDCYIPGRNGYTQKNYSWATFQNVKYCTDINCQITLSYATSKFCAMLYQCNEEGTYPQVYTNGSSTVFGSGNIGISCFYEALSHELKHVQIAIAQIGDGLTSLTDPDEDYYNTTFELDHQADYMFDPMDPNDNSNYQIPECPGFDWLDFFSQNPGDCITSGRRYEETECVNHQLNVINPTQYNDFDWSFDPTLLFQGKKW